MFKKLISYRVPRNLLVLIDVIALLLLFAYSTDELDKFTLITGIVLIFIIYVSNFILLKISSGDHYIFLIVTMLLKLGIIMIYRLNSKLGARQVVWVSGGILTFFISYIIVKKIKKWDRLTLFYGVGSIVLFLITLVFGKTIGGARNWIKFGNFGFQPSEIIKIAFIFFIASFYTNEEKFNKNGKSGYRLLIAVYIFIGFLFLQKDLGGALLFYLIFLVIQYVYEKDRKLILYNILLASIGAIVSYFIFDHVKIRVETWIDPWRYVDNKGYQITQSLFAIANGGFFGTGIGLGHPDFIPEVHTDFIFPAICEEMGIFTGIAIMMLFLILVYRGFKIALSQSDKFFRIVAFGISAMFGFQTFIIFGGVIKMIPLTGITVPFISYGGSSIISSFIALGILQVASEELPMEEVEEHE
ncbi:FtsW/RodA/SpoVE family cell cycle protein [Anaerosalibacter bizertensis]|uniref:FtsW/RodA/SpoVE family cell cycle protein n=2 Tax=Anaerosalibacter bizertensis TaxID=932217 RepID=A0A9Q4ADC6_9FIRM|nr:FtsW/RodA/SpoVE family cell cycle protein [Anaerosalibacter bizertensis]MBV1818274.1 FtsW/RodA/SpoVE family cell cycle protein [Bacteroidales bacterium MSK.15.36]MCG4565632.1 FtsW/RodA/SpoVE family cell cycle protein [Anaerosalibacter bizertensis]MCG4582709.1 FtsW/RodA/SpoVE family cell cycle protein [Anaerosalibacter bizertensis]